MPGRQAQLLPSRENEHQRLLFPHCVGHSSCVTSQLPAGHDSLPRFAAGTGRLGSRHAHRTAEAWRGTCCSSAAVPLWLGSVIHCLYPCTVLGRHIIQAARKVGNTSSVAPAINFSMRCGRQEKQHNQAPCFHDNSRVENYRQTYYQKMYTMLTKKNMVLTSWALLSPDGYGGNCEHRATFQEQNPCLFY
jgi:hypothetical protein